MPSLTGESLEGVQWVQLNPWIFETLHKWTQGFFDILMYQIAEQDVLSEQVLNSKIHSTHFLLSTDVVPNKQVGTK